MSHLALQLLGPFQAILDGQPLAGLESNKVRALLAYLAVEADRPHSRDEIIGLLWPDQPDTTARANLRQALANLRQAVGDRTAVIPFLLATFDSVQFQSSENCTIDVLTFRELLTSCRSHSHRRLETCRSCAQRLQQAVELYRGDFLAQFVQSGSDAFEEWALIHRERLHREVLDALFALAEHYDRRSEYDRAKHYATRQLELDPWREEAHRQVMRALALSGQRSAALAQYEACCRILTQALGAEPSQETMSLHARVKADRLTHADQQHNLPSPLTSLIGRKHELAEIDRLLDTPSCRLLTLTGPGGIGKTRLALQAAADHVGLFADGVWLVELAAIADPTLVLPAIATTLNLREHSSRPLRDVLADFLNRREILLVLDNCEHLIEACAQITNDLLRSCPQLTFFTTSRESLNVAGEIMLQVPTLTTPDLQGTLTGFVATDYEAVQLFLERAVAVVPEFTLNEVKVRIIAQICQQLDGMPLAIELAAAHLKTLSLEEIVSRLTDRLDLLTNGYRTALPRHQTLRATIDWSYALLSGPERSLLRRLSVFGGGWTLGAAREICASTVPDDIVSNEVFGLLAQLVTKSLVTVYFGSGVNRRYGMLEAIRQYANEKLIESGENEIISQRQLTYFLLCAESREPEWRSDDEKHWREYLESEIDNLRAALGWSLKNKVDMGLRLAGIYGRFCLRSIHASEGMSWLRKFLALPEFLARTSARANALRWASYLQADEPLVDVSGWSSRVLQRRSWIEESLAIYRELNEQSGVADLLWHLAAISEGQADRGLARAFLTESLEISQILGDKNRVARTLSQLGMSYHYQGDRTHARQLSEESLRIYRELRMRYAAAVPLAVLGNLAFDEGDLIQARSYCEESLACYCEADQEIRALWMLSTLSEIATRLGNYQEARDFIERSMAINQANGWSHLLGSDNCSLAFLAYAQGNYDQASALYVRGLPLIKGDQFEVSQVLEGLADTWAMQGKSLQAVQLLGSAVALQEMMGVPAPPIRRADVERTLASLRESMSEIAFNSAWNTGYAMTLEQAIDFALAVNADARLVAQID